MELPDGGKATGASRCRETAGRQARDIGFDIVTGGMDGIAVTQGLLVIRDIGAVGIERVFRRPALGGEIIQENGDGIDGPGDRLSPAFGNHDFRGDAPCIIRQSDPAHGADGGVERARPYRVILADGGGGGQHRFGGLSLGGGL